jgi:glycosyltransferase involved in cell wall biosynthesis
MISVVIPNLHSPIIDQVIGALEQQTARHLIREIIVVGQGDVGATATPRVDFLVTPRPLSAAAARNLGAKHATGDYILFIDADCIAAPTLVERLIERHREGYTVVGGGVADEMSRYWSQCDNTLVFADFLPTSSRGPRLYLPSLNFSIQRELFLHEGGFDEQFPGAAGEDIDLSLRLRQRGAILFFEPHAVVIHCHARLSARAVWNHLRRFGQVQVTLWSRYPTLPDVYRNHRFWHPLSGCIIACSPLLSLRDVLGLYATIPVLRRRWHLLPGMVWARTAWYWGLSEMLLVRSRDSHIQQALPLRRMG